MKQIIQVGGSTSDLLGWVRRGNCGVTLRDHEAIERNIKSDGTYILPTNPEDVEAWKRSTERNEDGSIVKIPKHIRSNYTPPKRKHKKKR